MLLTPTTLSTILLAASVVSAVPFGSGSNPGHATRTITTTVTTTATVTSGTPSTTYAFKVYPLTFSAELNHLLTHSLQRGNPPANKAARDDQIEQRAPQVITSSIAIAANVGRPNSTSTLTVTSTRTTTVSAATTTETVYPCSNPDILYGTASSSPNIAGTQNNRYGLDTEQGADVQGCCNTCLFDIENCVQAWWYFYQGCVVQQAVNVTETKVKGKVQGRSEQCPQGTIGGLEYGNNTNPAFRSTGNIVGPCGSAYTL